MRTDIYFSCILALVLGSANAFAPLVSRTVSSSSATVQGRLPSLVAVIQWTSTTLAASEDEDGGISEQNQGLLGAVGTIAALITVYSEFTLKTTGCGLPAGPFGLVGLAEGLSYLGVTGIVAYSVVAKVKTGSGLPAGPGGLLGLAEGLSFLAILVGLAVLGFQVFDYGYIPNAVPMDGGMCS